jgi:signal transduction histidine kinase/ActR/RegA family two-component response regulator
VLAAVARGQPFQTTYRLVGADGGVKWVWEQGAAVAAGGAVLEGVVLDVTESKRLEEQLRQAQKMEAVGSLTGGIAHDLNNILGVILANANLVARALPMGLGDVQDDVAEIEQAARHGAQMIRQLLAFSRRAELRIVPLNLTEVLENSVTMLRRFLPDNVRVEFYSDVPAPTVHADAGAVQQILLNLAANSRDAMPDGGRLVIALGTAELDETTARMRPWITPGRYVRVTVTDNGAGMDDETRSRIFEPFFTTKPATVGTGLGMAMVYGLMKQQRGHIHVYSEPGAGTTVSLYFPAMVDAARPAPEAEEQPHERWGRGETILLVEDDAALRRTTTRVLERFGYQVITAANGEEALELLEARDWKADLVLSDVVMPAMSGRGLYEALARHGRRIPFVFESGHAAGELRDRGQFPEGVHFIQKPWTVNEILTLIRRALAQRQE